MYTFELFTLNIDRLPDIDRNERCYRLNTGNPEDDVYAIVDTEMFPEDIERELRFNLVRKYGARMHGWTLAGNYEDVTDVLWPSEVDGWQREGWYRIGWSDGGMDWTSDGAIWLDAKQSLYNELACAESESTETHLPYAEWLGDGDEPNEG